MMKTTMEEEKKRKQVLNHSQKSPEKKGGGSVVKLGSISSKRTESFFQPVLQRKINSVFNSPSKPPSLPVFFFSFLFLIIENNFIIINN